MRQRPLGPADVDQAARLSDEAGWNQAEADWRLMLALGRGFGFETADGRLVASALTLPFDTPAPAGAPRFGWISMVLVAPAWRRRGLASRLLEACTAALEHGGYVPVLDATPAGREVYRRLGFADGPALQRFERPGMDVSIPLSVVGAALRPALPGDRAALAAFDAPVFGAAREPILRDLHARAAAQAFVAADHAGIAGYVLGRDGRRALQIGPLVARDAVTAIALLDRAVEAAAPKAVFIDAFMHQHDFVRRLAEIGFTPQRPFTRMHRGPQGPRCTPAMLYAAAGPELG